jgi:hypothetical protein
MSLRACKVTGGSVSAGKLEERSNKPTLRHLLFPTTFDLSFPYRAHRFDAFEHSPGNAFARGLRRIFRTIVPLVFARYAWLKQSGLLWRRFKPEHDAADYRMRHPTRKQKILTPFGKT